MRSLCIALVMIGASTASTTALGATAAWEARVAADKTAKPVCTDRADLSTCLQASPEKVNILEEDSTLTVTCVTKEVCDKISIGPEASGRKVSNIAASTVDDAGLKKTFPLVVDMFRARQSLGVFHDTSLLLALQVASGSAQRGSVTGSEEKACEALVTFAEYPRGRSGSARQSITAEILVDTRGNVLRKSPGFQFDENDTLKVWVVGRKSVVSTLQVTRTSAFRDLSVVRVLGAGENVPALGGERHADVADPCVVEPFEVEDFAPGQGTVQIAAVDGDTTKVLGAFDIQVHPLYVGMFTLGWARSDAVDSGFKVVDNGTESVIAPADISNRDNAFALFYTPFVWGKRDFEKPWRWDASLVERINPTIGVVVDDVSDNVLAGISIDLPAGIVITAGRHYRHVDVLSPQSGLSVGSSFSGTTADLPTARDWKSEKFVALSIDLRVMVKFFSSALGNNGN